MMNWKVLALRIGLLVAMAAMSVWCLLQTTEKYDPLARYPYANEANRDAILAHLDSHDIDFIVNQQIKPEEFMPWMEEPGFEIKNVLLYEEARQAQTDSPDNIVRFVNRYRDRLSLNTIRTLLETYSYDDLETFFDSGTELELVQNPASPYARIEENQTVYRYVPEGLEQVQHENVYLQPEAAKALAALEKGYEKVHDRRLPVKYGYLGYDELNALHLEDETVLPGGQNELQLGWSVLFEAPEDEEEQKEAADWLNENAWRYGFVQRNVDDPFLYRYVGEDNARAIRQGDLELEDLQ